MPQSDRAFKVSFASLSARLRASFASRPRVRRGAIVGAAFIVLAALAAVFAPWTFSTMALIEEIARQMRASSGLFIAARGRTVFSPLPRPHIDVQNIAFADPNGALVIEADRLHGNVAILPLLLGRLEIGELILERPRINLDLDRKPMSASGAHVRAAAAPPATAAAQKADDARLGEVTIHNGSARVKKGGDEALFEAIEATLDWPRVGAPATFIANFDWRGERPQAVLWIGRPGVLLRGDSSPVTVRLQSDSLKLEAEGLGQMAGKPRFGGRIALSSPSLRQALHLFGQSAPLPGPFENIELTAKASLGPREAQLSELRLTADDNFFEGSFLLRMEEERPIVQAALTSPFVSIKPMLADAPPMTGADGQWNREAFTLPDLAGADVDVRITAQHARFSRLALNDAALTLTLRDGRLDLALAEARAYKGSVKARATFAAGGAGLEFHAVAQTSGVDAGALLWDTAGRQDLLGMLDANVTLDSAGDSVAAVMRELEGRASLTLTQGEIVGIDLERALRRMDKRPLSSAIDIRQGRSTLDRASAAFKIAKGVANVEEGSARGPGFALGFTGAAKIAERAVTLKAQANEADGAGRAREKGLHIGFDISGSWDELALIPDAQALIKRSGAAAPLLPKEEGVEER